MHKKTAIKSFLVVPLIASAILLANPAYADQGGGAKKEVISHKGGRVDISGRVAGKNGSMFTIEDEEGNDYNVLADHAVIMRAADDPEANPELVSNEDIRVGDLAVVRGRVSEAED